MLKLMALLGRQPPYSRLSHFLTYLPKSKIIRHYLSVCYAVKAEARQLSYELP